MKTFWKALGIAALAAVVPVRFKKDEETGTKTYQSLLWKLSIGPKNEDNLEVGLDLMEGVLTAPLMDVIASRQEAALFTDDPEEAVLPADEAQAAADEAQIIADQTQTAADEAQTIADQAQTAADEAQTIADQAQTADDQAASEGDYDPYFF